MLISFLWNVVLFTNNIYIYKILDEVLQELLFF